MPRNQESPYRMPADYAIEVFRTEENLIGIKQESPLGEDDSAVLFSPERLDTLIGFLEAVKAEIMADRPEAARSSAF